VIDHSLTSLVGSTTHRPGHRFLRDHEGRVGVTEVEEDVMAESLVVLRGGAHNGSSTTVAEGVERLLTPSDAPGLLDVYERGDELIHLRGNEEPAEVWVLAGQEPIDRVTTEHGLPLAGHDIRTEPLSAPD
jgi:hypothetical protein